MLLVFVGMAVASKSTTSWLTILAFCCVEAIIALYRRGGAARLLGAFFSIALAPTLLLVAADPDPVLELIGKDPTVTGRTEIWGYVVNYIWMKPLLGWGYFAFWLPNNPAAMQISNAVRWMVPQAHNGLLELLLNVGAVGTGAFLFLFVRNIVLAVRCLRTAANELAMSTLIYYAGILLVGFSENVLLAPTQSSTTVFFITGLMCEKALRGAVRSRMPTQRTQASRLPQDAGAQDRAEPVRIGAIASRRLRYEYQAGRFRARGDANTIDRSIL
jgi:O-antigen ligase